MQCNIDARGKAARLIVGVVMLLLAAACAIGALAGVISGQVGIILSAPLAAFGFLGVFEGWKGWCALRALGFRTPL